jgi:hypothetical protein
MPMVRVINAGSLLLALTLGFPLLICGCGGADQTTGTHVTEPSPEVLKKGQEMRKKSMESGDYGKIPAKKPR